jgi:hypothetical protein
MYAIDYLRKYLLLKSKEYCNRQKEKTHMQFCLTDTGNDTQKQMKIDNSVKEKKWRR